MTAVEIPQTLEYRGGELNLAPVLESHFQPKLLYSYEHKPEPRHIKHFEAKYNKVKDKLALLSSSASAPSSSLSKNKGLITESYDWDEEEVSYDENEYVNIEILKENQNSRNEMKELTSIAEAWLNTSNKVNQCISEQIPTQKKKCLGIDQLTKDTSISVLKDLVFVKSLADNSKASITGSNKPKLSEAKDSTLSNHDTGKWINLQSVAPLPPLEKLTGAELVSDPKTIKSILKSKSTFKAETLKGIKIKQPSSAPARGNKSSLASKTYLAPPGVITCFFGFQIKQSERGISINNERKVKDMLGMYDKIGSSVNTPMVPSNMLGPYLNGKAVNESLYRGVI
nr:hypothetical protein [Tanacetum cinerariifolium]